MLIVSMKVELICKNLEFILLRFFTRSLITTVLLLLPSFTNQNLLS